MGRVLIGVILGVILAPVAVLAWIHFGSVPVAVADPPLPHERSITGAALHARIDRDLIATPPIQANEENLVAGAQVYRDQCAATAITPSLLLSALICIPPRRRCLRCITMVRKQ